MKVVEEGKKLAFLNARGWSERTDRCDKTWRREDTGTDDHAKDETCGCAHADALGVGLGRVLVTGTHG
jgi:hypothetical protein